MPTLPPIKAKLFASNRNGLPAVMVDVNTCAKCPTGAKTVVPAVKVPAAVTELVKCPPPSTEKVLTGLEVLTPILNDVELTKRSGGAVGPVLILIPPYPSMLPLWLTKKVRTFVPVAWRISNDPVITTVLLPVVVLSEFDQYGLAAWAALAERTKEIEANNLLMPQFSIHCLLASHLKCRKKAGLYPWHNKIGVA